MVPVCLVTCLPGGLKCPMTSCDVGLSAYLCHLLAMFEERNCIGLASQLHLIQLQKGWDRGR